MRRFAIVVDKQDNVPRVIWQQILRGKIATWQSHYCFGPVNEWEKFEADMRSLIHSIRYPDADMMKLPNPRIMMLERGENGWMSLADAVGQVEDLGVSAEQATASLNELMQALLESRRGRT